MWRVHHPKKCEGTVKSAGGKPGSKFKAAKKKLRDAQKAYQALLMTEEDANESSDMEE